MRKAIRRRIQRREFNDHHRNWLGYTGRGYPVERFDPAGKVSSRQVGPPSREQLAELKAAWAVLGRSIMAAYEQDHLVPPPVHVSCIKPGVSAEVRQHFQEIAERVRQHYSSELPWGLRTFGPPVSRRSK